MFVVWFFFLETWTWIFWMSIPPSLWPPGDASLVYYLCLCEFECNRCLQIEEGSTIVRAMCESLVSRLTLRRDCSLYKGFVQSYTTWTSTRPKNFWPTAVLISSCLPGKGFVILQLQNVLLPLTHRKHLFWYTSNGTVFDHNQLL